MSAVFFRCWQQCHLIWCDLVDILRIGGRQMMAKCPQVANRQQYLVAQLLFYINTCLIEITGYPIALKVLRGLHDLLAHWHRAIGRGQLGGSRNGRCSCAIGSIVLQ